MNLARQRSMSAQGIPTVAPVAKAGLGSLELPGLDNLRGEEDQVLVEDVEEETKAVPPSDAQASKQ